MTTRKKLPKGWRWAKLDAALEIDNQGIRPAAGTIYRYIGLENIEGGLGDFIEIPEVDGQQIGSGKYIFGERHILYGKLRPYLNKVALPEFDGICSTDILPLLPKSGMSKEYLAYWLRSKEFVDYATQYATGTKMPRLGPDRLQAAPIPLPPTGAEQERIVEVLRQADAIRRKRAEARRLADQIISSTFRKYFEKTELEQKSLGSLLFSTPQYGTSERANSLREGYPVLRIPNVLSGELDISDLKFVPGLTDKQKNKLLVSPSDILLVRTNGNRDYVGRCCVVPNDFGQDMVFASYLMRLRPDPNQVLPEYLDSFLRTEEARTQMLRKIPTSAGNYNINAKNLSSITIPVPAKDIQQRFVHIIAQHRVYSAKALQSETEQTALFNVLLSRAFMGELMVGGSLPPFSAGSN